jgi:hypothetical protein
MPIKPNGPEKARTAEVLIELLEAGSTVVCFVYVRDGRLCMEWGTDNREVIKTLEEGILRIIQRSR